MSQPAPPSGGEVHQFAQSEVIATPLAGMVAAAMAVLDPVDLRGSIAKLQALITAIVAAHGRMSAALAADYYRLERQMAGIAAPLKVVVAPPAGPEQVAASVYRATSGLWGPVNNSPIVHNGAPLATWDDRLKAAESNVLGVAENLSLNPGRQTIIDTVSADRHAKGWARVPEPGACSFCIMLATRGAVYKTETSAGTNTRSPRNKNSSDAFVGDGEFKVHDHCRCHAEPVFNAYEPTAQIRQWQADYKRVTKDRAGADARKAFRQWTEGRLPAEGTTTA